jgi:hypothetical protein
MLTLRNGYTISMVPRELIGESWFAVRRFLYEAVEQAWGYDLDDVLQRLYKEECCLWVLEKDMKIQACVVTEIINYPQGRALNIWLLGGEDFKEWKDCIASLESYARHYRCDFITGMARPGLMKLIRDLGFTKTLVTGVKTLDQRTH